MTTPILYEDTDVVVITKPAGVLVHPDGVSDEKTISDWMVEQYPQSVSVGEPLTLKDGVEIKRPGVVHRLDRDTSGVLILAKTSDAYEHLKTQFQERDASKEYLAFVYGVFKQQKGVVEAPIGRSAKDFKQWSAQRGARGALRDAYTEYEVLGSDREHSIVRFLPKTGRTHQIRVHAKYLNHPLVCDRLYAPKHECSLGFSRVALHAHRLSLMLPNGEQKTFEAPLPDDFIQALEGFDHLPF